MSVCFRENRLHDANELTKLACLKSLKTLVVSNNEFDGKSSDVVKSKLVKILPWLERIDKDAVNKIDVQRVADENSLYSEWNGEEQIYEEE